MSTLFCNRNAPVARRGPGGRRRLTPVLEKNPDSLLLKMADPPTTYIGGGTCKEGRFPVTAMTNPWWRCSDGELSGIQHSTTYKHLAVCRLCRTRRATLKCTVWRIRRSLAKRSFLDMVRAEGAMQRFLRWRKNFEMLRLTEPSNPSNDLQAVRPQR
jgi:hypothetical protein